MHISNIEGEPDMREVGQYCKAYPAKTLRKYNHWKENSDNTRSAQEVIDGNTINKKRILTDDDVLYIQESYVVTDGIFLNENVIFDQVNEDWKKYCTSVLNFEVPLRGNSPIAEKQLSKASSSKTKTARKPKQKKGENHE
jgi:hypothetical protein